MRIKLFCLFIFIAFSKSTGQELISKQESENPLRNAIELTHDNDFLFSTDRYYTTGSFIGWRSLAERKNDSLDRLQYRLVLSQEIYTPFDIVSTNIDNYDRPYAGFLGISGGVTNSNKKRLFDYRLLTGFTGPISGANTVQSVFHESATVDSHIPAWKGEIKMSYFLNLYFTYVREWIIQPNPFSVHIALSPKAAFGNRDIYMQQDLVFYVGKRNSLDQSAAYHQIGNFTKELFFAIRLGYRYVFHNAILEGNVLGDSSELLISPYPNLFQHEFEIHYRGKRNSYKLSSTFSTPKASGTEPHLYGTLSIIRSF